MIKRTKVFWLVPVIAALIFLTGCSEPPAAVSNVRLTGTIATGDGLPASGKVQVQLFHAWALEGLMRHPLEFIEGFEAGVGEFSHEFAYPLDTGEGLVVYAWLDADGDGVLCTPTRRDDTAGLVEVQDFPAAEIRVDILLSEVCAAPNWFFPSR
jgi:hypothetical protein